MSYTVILPCAVLLLVLSRVTGFFYAGHRGRSWSGGAIIGDFHAQSWSGGATA